MLIPDKYLPLFRTEATHTHTPGVMAHHVSVMRLALTPKVNSDILSIPAAIVYRFCFDKLFNYLDRIYRLVIDEQLRKEDLSELKYWLERLQRYEWLEDETEAKEVFVPYISLWEYFNVERLWQLLEVPPLEVSTDIAAALTVARAGEGR